MIQNLAPLAAPDTAQAALHVSVLSGATVSTTDGIAPPAVNAGADVPEPPPAATNDSEHLDQSAGGMPGWAVAITVVVGLLLVAALAVGIYCFFFRPGGAGLPKELAKPLAEGQQPAGAVPRHARNTMYTGAI